MEHFVARTRLPYDPQAVFQWHDTPGAAQRLVPPWSRATITDRPGRLVRGAQTVVELPFGMRPFGIRWIAKIEKVEPPEGFVDEQVEGPMRHWRHRHGFVATREHGTILEDQVEYSLPGGRVGAWIGNAAIDRRLRKLFRFRHERTAADLSRHAVYRGLAPLRIAISGTHGMVGSALTAFLTAGGHQVIPIVRGGGPGAVAWDTEKGSVAVGPLRGVDAVVHLAAENLFSMRWTERKKETILRSRKDGTAAVAAAAAAAGCRTFICASAVGYYGDRRRQLLTESTGPGDGFLADVVKAWETAAAPARAAGARTVHLRLGMILSTAGGALPMMLRASRWALAGRLGSGHQIVPWIALDDVLGAVLLALYENVDGPINVVSPQEVEQRELIETIASVVHRPVGPPVPELALRAAAGDLATELLLPSARVRPTVLEGHGFVFRYGDLERALRFETGRFGYEHPTEVLTGSAAEITRAA